MADGKYVHRHYRNHYDSRNAGTHPTTTSHTHTHSSRHLREKGLIWAFLWSFVLFCCAAFTSKWRQKNARISRCGTDTGRWMERIAEYLIRSVY